MELLFANYIPPEQMAEKETTKHCMVTKNGEPPKPKPLIRAWWDVLIEQVINSAIVGGVAAASTGFTEWEVGLKAFVITALIELRKYRKL